jgi:hypothetical protein
MCCEAGRVAPHHEVWTAVWHKLDLPGAIGRRDCVRKNHFDSPTGSHAAKSPDALSLVAIGRHDGLAQLKRCGAQDGAVHGTGVQVAGTSVEQRKADDNSNRQNAPHNQNLTRFPARRQLHKQGAVLADDDGVTNGAFFVALHMSHFGPSWTSRDVGHESAIGSLTNVMQTSSNVWL